MVGVTNHFRKMISQTVRRVVVAIYGTVVNFKAVDCCPGFQSVHVVGIVPYLCYSIFCIQWFVELFSERFLGSTGGASLNKITSCVCVERRILEFSRMIASWSHQVEGCLLLGGCYYRLFVELGIQAPPTRRLGSLSWVPRPWLPQQNRYGSW